MAVSSVTVLVVASTAETLVPVTIPKPETAWPTAIPLMLVTDSVVAPAVIAATANVMGAAGGTRKLMRKGLAV